MIKVLIRCADCKRNGWVEFTETERNGRTHHTHSPTGYTVSPSDRRDIIQTAYSIATESSPLCQNHIRTAHTVEGTYNPDRACDGRCMGAVGPICSCSCGGENHGGKFGSW